MEKEEIQFSYEDFLALEAENVKALLNNMININLSEIDGENFTNVFPIYLQDFFEKINSYIDNLKLTIEQKALYKDGTKQLVDEILKASPNKVSLIKNLNSGLPFKHKEALKSLILNESAKSQIDSTIDNEFFSAVSPAMEGEIMPGIKRAINQGLNNENLHRKEAILSYLEILFNHVY